MIALERLTKAYGERVVVDGLTLRIEPGAIYGLLGPNGAGKTTTLMMLLGIVRPSSGSVSLFGTGRRPDDWRVRFRIGVMEETQHLYGEMTAYAYLRFFADLYGVNRPASRTEAVLELVGLSEAGGRPLREFSKGMQQKIGLARALVHDPELVILDEPVSSLDPHGVREVREIIRQLHQAGKTIVISSHVLSEVEKTCSRVAVMNRGRLVADGPIDVVKQMTRSERRYRVDLDAISPALLAALNGLPFVKRTEAAGDSVIVAVEGTGDYRRPISRTISEAGATVLGLRELEASLEEAFVTLTEQNLEGMIGGVEQ